MARIREFTKSEIFAMCGYPDLAEKEEDPNWRPDPPPAGFFDTPEARRILDLLGPPRAANGGEK